MKKDWEDIKTTLFSTSNLLAGIWPVFLFCAAFGVYEPLKLGPDWLQSPIMVVSLSVLVPFIVIGFISPYAFVGERERGTLEPLLTTPVSDQALLFGKISMAVLYGWGAAILCMLLGLGLINFFVPYGRLILNPLNMVILTILASLLFSLLVATIGTSSSFYAKTILEAQRSTVMILLVPMLLPAFMAGPLMPSAWKGFILQIIAQTGASSPLLVLMVILLITDGLAMAIALIRFHRKQLLLG